MEVKDVSVHQFVLMEGSVDRLTIYHSIGPLRELLTKFNNVYPSSLQTNQ